MDCKALLEDGELLRERQIDINNRLRHEHAKLTVNDKLLASNQDLDNQIRMHGRAVRQSVELQDQADDALRRGDVQEAERLMELAAQALPDDAKLPTAPPSKDTSAPQPDKAKEPADTPPPAPPVKDEPVDKDTPEPRDQGAHRAPDPTPDPDLSGLEQRLMARIDAGFDKIEAQVEGVGLPDGYREVLEEFSPEDLRTVLRAGRWGNSKRWNKKSKSESPHNNGVAEDGDPQH